MRFYFNSITLWVFLIVNLSSQAGYLQAASWVDTQSDYVKGEERVGRGPSVIERQGQVRCGDVALQRVIALIARYGEGRKLLESACRRGSITVSWGSLGRQGAEALWDDNSRSVIVNCDRASLEGQRLCWVVFELHNALTSEEFDAICMRARQGQVSKEEYVRQVEKHEHRNALQARALIEGGVRRGLYPQEALWPVIKSFEDHYRMQQLMGHSFWIADQYDSFFSQQPRLPYCGTIPGLCCLSSQERELLLRYLVAKQSYIEGSTEERARARHFLQKEFRQGLTGRENRLRWLRLVIGEGSELEESAKASRRLV